MSVAPPEPEGRVCAAMQDGVQVLRLEGDVRFKLGPAIGRFSDAAAAAAAPVVVDLSRASGVDSTCLGMLARLSVQQREHCGAVPVVYCPGDDLHRVLDGMSFDQLAVVTRGALALEAEFVELPRTNLPETDLRQQVIDAHRVLMALSDANCDAFSDLVAALSAEGQAAAR